MQDYSRLKAWHLARAVAVQLAEALWPRLSYRVPGLRTQMIRAAVSISSNLAEGCGKRSQPEFRRYVEISLGSLLEVESDLGIALRTRLLTTQAHRDLARKCAVLRRMLKSLIQSIDSRSI